MGCTETERARFPKASSFRQLLILLLVIFAAAPAAAQRVVLVPPPTEDALLNDAFNRLVAELDIHHFDTLIVNIDLDVEPTQPLTRIAQGSDALASIAFQRREGQTLVQIWLVDRVSGKATMRGLEVGEGSDAASLIAIRAVDLLRASFREFNPDEKPPPEVANVDRRTMPVVVRTLAAATPPRFALRVDSILLYERPSLGFGIGPALSGAMRLGAAAELALTFAGPVIGAKFDTAMGSASVRQELCWVEGRWDLIRLTNVRLGAGLFAGALFLHASGQPAAPLLGQSDDVWGALGGMGIYSQVPMTSRIALELALRTMMTVPQLGVAIERLQTRVGAPITAGSLGVRVAI